jgi:preprotein translocase subunit SecA
MTGTGKTTEKEFQDIYNLKVVVLPTEKKLIRKDLADLVYQTELAKWKAVLAESKKCYQTGQPILIGTASVEKSEFLSELFNISQIPHQVLNAKPENVKRESEIVAQAGERFAVTIATNMAGRGTDIILGGNPIFKIKQRLSEFLLENKKIENNSELENLISLAYKEYDSNNQLEKLETDIQNLPYSLENCLQGLQTVYKYLSKIITTEWEKENKLVKDLGGLFVLGTERHETRRIDNQLRGRAGRQGDPGTSQFVVSLEDELIKVFGGDNIRRWVDYLIQDKDVPLESDLLTKSLENAQKKVELYNYDLRKNVFQYDDILNVQRKNIFESRNELLSKNIYENLFLRFSEYSLDEELINRKNMNSTELRDKIEKQISSYSMKLTKKNKKVDENTLYKEAWISNDIRLAQSNFYELGLLKSSRSTLYLSIIDFYWTEHIERMNFLRETINWRSYGQQTPLVEYNLEAFKSFKLMFEQIRSCMLYYFLSNSLT